MGRSWNNHSSFEGPAVMKGREPNVLGVFSGGLLLDGFFYFYASENVTAANRGRDLNFFFLGGWGY